MTQAKHQDSVDIELRTPIDMDGTKVTKLRMREATVVDQRAVAKLDEVDSEVQLFANLCGVDTSAIDRLSLHDYSKLQKAYKAFIR